MPYAKAYEILLPNEYLRVKLFYHLAKDIYNVFEFSDGLEVAHNKTKLDLKQLYKLNENIHDTYVDNSMADVFVKIKFTSTKAQYAILEKLFACVRGMDTEEIEKHLKKYKTKK